MRLLLTLLITMINSPVCLDRPIYPCRGLCERVRQGCEGRMKTYGYPWPDMLRCDKFPLDNDMCIGPLSSPSISSAEGKPFPQFFNSKKIRKTKKKKGKKNRLEREKNTVRIIGRREDEEDSLLCEKCCFSCCLSVGVWRVWQVPDGVLLFHLMGHRWGVLPTQSSYLPTQYKLMTIKTNR